MPAPDRLQAAKSGPGFAVAAAQLRGIGKVGAYP
jgi:hypothetical protein